MFIATLPAVHQDTLLEEIISHPLIQGVRYNTGLASAYPAKETLERILVLTERHNKRLWVDLKGRQLRIVQWAVPNYGKIILNHELEVDCPACVFFRGSEWSEVKVVRGNAIYIDPPPPHAVGEGQAINIHGNNLKIKGYLIEQDKEYIKASRELRVNDYMISFVECEEDMVEVAVLNPEARMVLKIESPKGLDFIDSMATTTFEKHPIMAARDDLMINIGSNKVEMLLALQRIIQRDPGAILASRIFSGLETGGSVSLADISDLRLMHLMGYKHFMLSDGICERHFKEAMKVWQDFQKIFGNEGGD